MENIGFIPPPVQRGCKQIKNSFIVLFFSNWPCCCLLGISGAKLTNNQFLRITATTQSFTVRLYSLYSMFVYEIFLKSTYLRGTVFVLWFIKYTNFKLMIYSFNNINWEVILVISRICFCLFFFYDNQHTVPTVYCH